MPQLADVDRHRLRPADERRAADHRDQRKQHRADRIGVHDRIERDAAEQPRGRIAEPIGRPRMRHLVHGQRKQQNDERDEDLREVDVQQGVTGYGRLAKNARTASATFAPTTAASSSRVARRTPARLPNVVSSVAPAARADAGHVVELRSQIAHRPRAAMERDREAMRFVADALHQQQRRIVGGQRDRILAVARVEQLLLLRDADRDEVREPELLERRVGRRQLALAAVDQRSDPETVRPARAACDSGAARLRASRRSRPGRRGSGLGTGTGLSESSGSGLRTPNSRRPSPRGS